MSADELMLAARELTLGYGQRRVLSNVDIEVRAGQFWFFLGPNGEGKTTLLRAILGVLRPQTGRLWLHQDLRSRECIGFVPQWCELNPILPTTVREFVLLGLVGVRVSRHEQDQRLAWALRHAGLADAPRRGYWALSGGQRQRAVVARALVRRPRLLVLDEPTSHLDPSMERGILNVLGNLNKEEGTTVLFVSHDLHIAARYATHVALFRAGRVSTRSASELRGIDDLEQLYNSTINGCDGDRQ